MTQLLYQGNEWDFPMLERCLAVVEEVGRNELGMTNLYPNQVEIISSNQMLDAYSSHGMPIMYNHWSFGKRLVRDDSAYRRGHMGLAYEIIVNTNPCIAYLMEENSATMQLLVLAHASVGHNYCFANNYMFRQWTDADAIVDYLNFAKKYILDCEEKYGAKEVESLLDSCHALMSHGVDKYNRARKLNGKREEQRLTERLEEWARSHSEMWYTLDPNVKKQKPKHKKLLDEPEENILYFIEKNSPILKPWQREIVRICRKISQYWYPQMFTKVLNEGIATFTHHYILNSLYDQDRISDAHMMEWISSHANVIYQPSFDSKYFSGINPYALGFAIFRDIRRICENPTDEDREWFPLLAGQDWKSAVREAATQYRDDSFIMQFLSPKVSRDLRLFGITDDKSEENIVVNSIHNIETFSHLRTNLAQQYDHNSNMPNILVVDADISGDRTLRLEHRRHHNRDLDKNTDLLLAHIQRLWGFSVKLHSVDAKGYSVNTYTMT